MPRGGSTAGRGKKSHKGQRRMFTNEDELAQQHEEEKKKAWRRQRGLECEGEEGGSGNSSSDDSDSEDECKSKGVGHLIDIDNPNRVVNKTKKAAALNVEQTPTQSLSRREREEIEKQQARIRYQQLHVMGKTEEARADLARLALIKKQREESARKREDDKKAKDDAKSTANKLKGKS